MQKHWARLPLGVKLLIIYYALTALIFPFLFYMGLGSIIPPELLGAAGLSSLIGAMVGIVTVIGALYTLLLLYGLWHLKKWVWWLIVILTGLGILMVIGFGGVSWQTAINTIIIAYMIWIRNKFGAARKAM